MAYDFDSYLKKKGITGERPQQEGPRGTLDSAVDRIESAEAQDQGYSLDEYRNLKQKSQQAHERNKGIKKAKGFGDYAEDVVRGVAEQPALRAFSKGATAGLSEPLAAGISSLIQKGMGDERGLKDVYQNVAGSQRESFEENAAQNPIQNLLGEIAGIAAPGGAFSRLYGAAGKATNIPSLASEGLPLAKRIGLKTLQAGLKGGAANLGFGAANKAASELNLEDEKWAPVKDFLLGAAGDIVSIPVEKTLGYFAKAANLRNVSEGIPLLGKVAKGAREDAEGAAKTAFENAKEAYRSGETSRMMKAEADSVLDQRKAVEDFKEMVQKDPITAAQSLFKKLKNVDVKLGKDYGATVDPVMSKYRLKKIDATPFKEQVDEILDRFGVIDEAGNVDLESMKGFIDFDPESKGLIEKLVSFKDGLTDDTSISKLERGVRSLQKAAKFQKGIGFRSASEETLGDLSRRLKDFMTDRIGQFASPEEVVRIQQAKAIFAEGKKALKDPLKVVGRFESKPARIAVNLRSQLPADTMQNLMKLDPSLADEFGELFLNNLTGHSVSPRKFTKEIDYFGPSAGPERSRDILKQILGEERFAQLEGAEKNLHESAVPWKKRYIPEPPPQLNDIPPGKMDEIYEMLAQFMRSPDTLKKKLGAESMPSIGSLLAHFLSQNILNK